MNWHDPRNDTLNEKLYVVTAITNPVRYYSRYRLYHDFEKHIAESNATLYTIEAAFGDRSHAVTDSSNPQHIQLRIKHELWLKENLLNLAIQRLPSDWKYVAWIDADVLFVRPDWVSATLHALQHYDVIQPWSEALDLNPKNEAFANHKSYMWCYKNEYDMGTISNTYGQRKLGLWHPGYAWAARRSAIDHLGGLIDWGILGGGDMFMANALIGELTNRKMPASLGKIGIRWLLEWQYRAIKYIRKNVGYIDGTICHYWHGNKANRRYKDRGQILTDANFNPELDMKKDWQGVWQLTDRSITLRDNIRRYFRERDEDSTQ